VKSLDGNAVRTQRTRQRILARALELFNEQGEANVATGAIAASLGISPGNLYYHFRRKDAIVAELFHRFEQRIDVEPAPASSPAAAIEDLWLYLHLMLEAIWEFRFLYRGLDDLVERDRKLRESFNRIAQHKLDAVTRLCEGLVRSGAMRASREEIRALSRNVLVVATYWLSFQALRRRPGPIEDGLGHGAYQVMALVAPFLVGEAREHLDELSRAYID